MGVLNMNTNEYPLSMLFYLLSIVTVIVGVILGIFFMISGEMMGIIIIIFSIISGIILFGLSKVLKILDELKSNVKDLEKLEKKEMNRKEEAAITDSRKEADGESDQPYDVPVVWNLTQRQKASILDYYRKDDQFIKENEILISPFKNYCVIKTKKFVDVIELVDDNPITLNRDQVEGFSGLNQWIEKNVFMKKGL